MSLRFKVGDVVRYVGDVEFDGRGTEVVVIGVDPEDRYGLVYQVVPVWNGSYEQGIEWVTVAHLEGMNDDEE